jgi:predicted AAA+ superfamily ATPase
MKASPIVGVFGHRQTGKTTLISLEATEYVTFDNLDERELCLATPKNYIQNRKTPFAIDECQYCPPLFPALKESVRIAPKRGHFLLSGSVRFTSRKAISESLTGRILSADLLPLTMRETHSLPFQSEIELLVKGDPSRFLRKTSTVFSHADVNEYLIHGGLPGICFHRSNGLRIQKFKEHLNTILNRDLRLISETTLELATLKNLIAVLSRRQCMPLNWSELSQETRISRKTLPQILSAFESLYLIRWIETADAAKPTSYFFEDQGLASFLTSYQGSNTTFTAMDMTRAIYSNLRAYFYYTLDNPARTLEYRTRGGSYIPLIFDTPDISLAILPIGEPEPTRSALLCAGSFLNSTLPFNKNRIVIIAHTGTEKKLLHNTLISMPWMALL